MAKKTIKKKVNNSNEGWQYSKINPNAAGLTIGTISFIFSLIIIVSLNFLSDNSGNIPINSGSKIILFIISAFIEGTILGYVVAWIYNKFIYIAK
ncbi:hypothetical protein HYV49_01270 [Candidatus Pacearchaeota archaeon]|nr:hypothetical protein [Candidatus Pacearchaeota archaeon]